MAAILPIGVDLDWVVDLGVGGRCAVDDKCLKVYTAEA